MYKKAPQATIFDLIRQIQRVQRYVFYAILLLSVISSLVAVKIIILPESLNNLKDIIFICLTLFLFILTGIIDYYLLPGADRKTRCDFFDNAFGTKFITSESSEEYYTNDELEKGIYKMAVNLFESVLYTLTISKQMIIRRAIFSAFLFTFLIVLAFYGIKDSYSFFILLLQAMLSSYFIGGFLKLLIFVIKNNSYFEELQHLFANDALKAKIIEHEAQIIRLYADYESNKGWANIVLSNKIYKKINPKLMEEWNGIKIKYNIN